MLTLHDLRPDQVPPGLCTNREAARAHGQVLRTREAFPPALFSPDFGDDDAIEELAVFYPSEGGEMEEDSSTGYLVTPPTLTAVYEPEAEE